MQCLALVARAQGDVCSMPAGALLKLTINGNRLTAMAPECGQLTNLRELHLQGNQLTELPTQLYQLTVSLHAGMQFHVTGATFLVRPESEAPLFFLPCPTIFASSKEHAMASMEFVLRSTHQNCKAKLLTALRLSSPTFVLLQCCFATVALQP